MAIRLLRGPPAWQRGSHQRVTMPETVAPADRETVGERPSRTHCGRLMGVDGKNAASRETAARTSASARRGQHSEQAMSKTDCGAKIKTPTGQDRIRGPARDRFIIERSARQTHKKDMAPTLHLLGLSNVLGPGGELVLWAWLLAAFLSTLLVVRGRMARCTRRAPFAHSAPAGAESRRAHRHIVVGRPGPRARRSQYQRVPPPDHCLSVRGWNSGSPEPPPPAHRERAG